MLFNDWNSIRDIQIEVSFNEFENPGVQPTFYSQMTSWFWRKKRVFIRNGHKILKNPPKSIIHDYGVIGYFLKSWNWILQYYKTHWIQNHSDSFKLRLIQVLELENFSKSRKKRMWYSIWQWPEFSRGKNIICPLEKTYKRWRVVEIEVSLQVNWTINSIKQ